MEKERTAKAISWYYNQDEQQQQDAYGAFQGVAECRLNIRSLQSVALSPVWAAIYLWSFLKNTPQATSLVLTLYREKPPTAYGLLGKSP